MASDAVHKSLEGCVPAMEYYLARKIFTQDEVKEIIKKRTTVEYTLHGPAGSNYVEVQRALNYEKSLEGLRRRRSKRVPLKNRFDEHIIQRIMNLYERFEMTMRGEDRIELAYDQVRWLKTVKGKDYEKKAGLILGRLLTEHPTREDIHVFSARWELENHLSIDNARAVLQRGLRFVPKGRKLWRAYFMIELTYVGELLEKLKEEDGEGEEEVDANLRGVLNGVIPRVVHAHCMTAFAADATEQMEMAIDLLKIAGKFPFSASLQLHLCTYLAKGVQEGRASRNILAKAKMFSEAANFVILSSAAKLPTDYCGCAAVHDPADDQHSILTQLRGMEAESDRSEAAAQSLHTAFAANVADKSGLGLLLLASEVITQAYSLEDKLIDGITVGEYVGQGSDFSTAEHPHVVEAVAQLREVSAFLSSMAVEEVRDAVNILSAFLPKEQAATVTTVLSNFLQHLRRTAAFANDKQSAIAAQLAVLFSEQVSSIDDLAEARQLCKGVGKDGADGDVDSIGSSHDLAVYLLLCTADIVRPAHRSDMHEKIIALVKCCGSPSLLPGYRAGDLLLESLVTTFIKTASQMNVGSARDAALIKVLGSFVLS